MLKLIFFIKQKLETKLVEDMNITFSKSSYFYQGIMLK